MSASLQTIDQRTSFPSYRAPVAAAPKPAHADVLAPLDRQAVTIRADRNEEIFAQGAPAQHCYFVVSGCVRTVKLMEDGRRQVGEFLLPGDVFGWDALDEHDFACEAVTPVTLRRYERAQLETLAEHDRGFARRLRELTSGKLRIARERLVTLGRKTATEKIAGFLLEMADRGSINGHGQIELPMNRTDIADHLGLTIETVCRVLTQLRLHGTIAIDRSRIAIRDRRALGDAGCVLLH